MKRTDLATDEGRAGFWAKAEQGVVQECWRWTRFIDRHGYGQVQIGGRVQRAHRVAYEIAMAQIPEGLDIDHLCHNRDAACPGGSTCLHRRCINPLHLEPATRGINTLRGKSPSALAAARTSCPAGHPYDEQNTYRPTRGQRGCRACRRASQTRANRSYRIRRPPRKLESGAFVCQFCETTFVRLVRARTRLPKFCSWKCRPQSRSRAGRAA